MNSIKIYEHNPRWTEMFLQEKRDIKEVLSSYLKEVHHIGSTAITDMPAKPILDILLEINSIDEIDTIERGLIAQGCKKLSRNVIPHRSFITTKTKPYYAVNYHIFEMGDPQIARYLRFKDYLNRHTKQAKAYASLKKELAKTANNDINTYVLGKSTLVRSIDAAAKLCLDLPQDIYCRDQNKGSDIENWDSNKVINSLEANFIIMMTHYMQYLTSIKFERIPGYVLIDTELHDANFNMILDTHLSSTNAEPTIKKICDHFKKHDLPFTWWITPGFNPSNLPNLLEKQGLKKMENLIGVVIDLKQTTFQTDLSLNIKKISSTAQFQELQTQLSDNNVTLTQYIKWIAKLYTKDDPIEIYAAFSGNTLVGAAELVFYANCAGIYHLSLINSDSISIKLAIENFLLEQAKKNNYHLAIMLPLESELKVYIERKFVPVCTFQKWCELQ